ncbi:MAG: subclass B1 metallo-beta-lactamase [Candidatus Azobacteroides sp.]|nr:subclass B1 metallo-beta-lactamase [Candidatus Azobacteroides sp.]
MKVRICFLLFVVVPMVCYGQRINKDLEVIKLTDHVYQHISWEDVGKWGRVDCNGLIIVDNGKALMVDTPMDSIQTHYLYMFIKDSLHAELVYFLPGHWHDDCIGGMPYLQQAGVETYANKHTNQILASQGLSPAMHSFQDSLVLAVGNIQVKSYYLGGGHATDNIVVWIPEDKVLFGGCMVKDCKATNIGNTADAAPFPEWISTIDKIENKFPDARYIVPGHGKTGGKELLEHTRKMIEEIK